jgi:hypothetical protein
MMFSSNSFIISERRSRHRHVYIAVIGHANAVLMMGSDQ